MLLLVLLGACRTSDPAPVFEPVLTAHESIVLWQGFSHDWTYNHRWGRLGSGFVYVDPSLDPAGYPLDVGDVMITLPDTAQWTYMGTAGAGTGKDNGVHHAWGTVIDGSAGLALASTTAAVRVEGSEGAVATGRVALDLPLPAGFAGLDDAVVLLNGVWLRAAGDEAKQPFHFAVRVGDGEVHDGSLAVEVGVELGLDCDTPECVGCAAKPTEAQDLDIVYDVYVALAVLGGEVGLDRVASEPVSASWEGPPRTEGEDACLSESDLFPTCLDYWVSCGDPTLVAYEELDPAVGVRTAELAPVAGFDHGTVGLTGITLDLDHAHHMVGFTAGVADVSWGDTVRVETDVRFQNWRQGMNVTGQDYDVLSATAFGTAGSYEGALELGVLGLPAAPGATVGIDESILTLVTQQLLVEEVGG